MIGLAHVAPGAARTAPRHSIAGHSSARARNEIIKPARSAQVDKPLLKQTPEWNDSFIYWFMSNMLSKLTEA